MKTILCSKTFIWVTIFSIAMGFLETAVVVYARALYFPEGFSFPLVPIDGIIAQTELWREIATIVMLIAIGYLAGKSKPTRFAYFIYSFAVWDIFYYVFLKVILDWPSSLFTWDLLFLVPVTWVGPVISPVIVAFTMILFSLLLLKYDQRMNWKQLGSLTISAVTLILSFSWDYALYVFQAPNDRKLWSFSLDADLFTSVADYIPTTFNWPLFMIGELLFLATIVYYVHSTKPRQL